MQSASSKIHYSYAQRHTKAPRHEDTPEHSTTEQHTKTKTDPEGKGGTQIIQEGTRHATNRWDNCNHNHVSNSNSLTQNRQQHPSESARATQSQQNITYLDGAISHVGDAERKRGSALVDFNLLPVGRQHLTEADALFGLAENLEVGNRQKRALKTTVTPAAGKDARGGQGEGGLRIIYELMAKQRVFPCWGLHG